MNVLGNGTRSNHVRRIPLPEDATEQTEFNAFRREALFVSDAEMYRRIGLSHKVLRVAVRELEKRQVFPAKDPLFGNKRYWPAVRAFLDARAGIGSAPPKRKRMAHGVVVPASHIQTRAGNSPNGESTLARYFPNAHTLNRCGSLELIDGTRIQPKFHAFRF